MNQAVADLERVLAKVRRRLIPFLFLLFIVSYLDRINVGFAALQMNASLGFSPRAYGLGAGIFFVSYVLFEIPSNVLLARLGVRIWFARIMISWGLVSAGMMFVRGVTAFYVLRFLLGAAEAGFFPGVIFYLTRWFPPRERARAVAAFMTAIVVAGVVGGPVSGALLSMNGIGGLAGWQWLFLIEGLPAIALGFAVLRVLDEHPDDARWLTASERAVLGAALREQGTSGEETITDALRNRRTWLLAAIYFIMPVTNYAIGFWMPQMLKTATGATDFEVGVLAAIPYAVGAVAMIAVGRHSDRTGERRWHLAASAVVAAAGLLASTASAGVVWTVTTLSVAVAGVVSMFGPFWALATAQIGGVGAAAAIALVNSVGNTGGFVGPYLLGAVSDATHSFAAGLIVIAAILFAGAILVLRVRERI